MVLTMAYPGTLGTPFFDGRNITDFLEQYKDLCADYRLSSAGKKFDNCKDITRSALAS